MSLAVPCWSVTQRRGLACVGLELEVEDRLDLAVGRECRRSLTRRPLEGRSTYFPTSRMNRLPTRCFQRAAVEVAAPRRDG
jgi:hypothetical protein